MPQAPLSPKTKEILREGKGQELSTKTRESSSEGRTNTPNSPTIKHNGKTYVIKQI